MSRITQVKVGPSDSAEVYNIGTTFEQVWASESNSYTLNDLYTYLKEYFNDDNATFVMRSKNEPENSKVAIWLQEIEDTDSEDSESTG